MIQINKREKGSNSNLSGLSEYLKVIDIYISHRSRTFDHTRQKKMPNKELGRPASTYSICESQCMHLPTISLIYWLVLFFHLPIAHSLHVKYISTQP